MAERTAAGMAVEAPALMAASTAASTALRMKVAASSCRWVTVGFHVRRCIVNPASGLGQDISARSGGETGEQRRPILRLVLAGLALVHDLVLIVVHDRPLVLLLIQLQLLVSIPSPQPKLSLILIYRNHWQNANRVSAHSESSHNPYTHVCKRSHAAPPVALFTPLSFRRSLLPVNAVHQLLPCWFASQARSSYLSARWILPTIPARDAPFLLIAHCPPTLCSHMPRSYMPRSFTPLPSPGFFGLPHIFAAPQDPHTCLHSRHSPSCVLKCAPKRQAREHKDANERIRARTLEIPRLTSFISSNGIPTAIHSSSTVHSQYVVAKPQHNQAPPHEKSPQHHFLGFKGLIAALADIYLHFKGLLFVNPPYIDGDIPPLILRILADSNPSKRR